MRRTPAAQALIARCVAAHRPGDHPRTLAIRERLTEVITDFVASGRADPKFLDELLIDERTFWARASEALVAARLAGKVFPARKGGRGPDLLVLDGAQRVWIEVVCPQPTRVPNDWLDPPEYLAYSLPDRELTLRWTAAIKQKAEMLLGIQGGMLGYLAKGIVKAADAYVIAVNACQTRSGPFPALFGISGLPFAAQAVFPIGSRQVAIDTRTGKMTGQGHQYRPTLKTDNGAPVATHMFLDPSYAPVSAIWALDFDGSAAIGNSEPSVLIHNPLAMVAVTPGFLPADEEFVATRESDALIITAVRT